MVKKCAMECTPGCTSFICNNWTIGLWAEYSVRRQQIASEKSSDNCLDVSSTHYWRPAVPLEFFLKLAS